MPKPQCLGGSSSDDDDASVEALLKHSNRYEDGRRTIGGMLDKPAIEQPVGHRLEEQSGLESSTSVLSCSDSAHPDTHSDRDRDTHQEETDRDTDTDSDHASHSASLGCATLCASVRPHADSVTKALFISRC
eukprot:1743422-Rhodomonas_salina.2